MGIDKKQLNKLKQEADKAFNTKQQAYEVRKMAFDKLAALVQTYNDELWEKYKKNSQKNSAEIESLREEADWEHREMVRSFEEAHQEYEEGDGALAKELSIEGYDHQARRDKLNQLVQKLCRDNSTRKAYVEKHQLPGKITELLKMDLNALRALIPQGDILSRFIIALEDTRCKDREFHRLDAEHAVTLRVGKPGTNNEGDTLIADGHVSRKQFDKKHNHYGDNRYRNIKEKRIEKFDYREERFRKDPFFISSGAGEEAE